MTELIFVVEELPEGGLMARALGESIFTQAAYSKDLEANIREAVQCHFDPGKAPRIIISFCN